MIQYCIAFFVGILMTISFSATSLVLPQLCSDEALASMTTIQLKSVESFFGEAGIPESEILHYVSEIRKSIPQYDDFFAWRTQRYTQYFQDLSDNVFSNVLQENPFVSRYQTHVASLQFPANIPPSVVAIDVALQEATIQCNMPQRVSLKTVTEIDVYTHGEQEAISLETEEQKRY